MKKTTSFGQRHLCRKGGGGGGGGGGQPVKEPTVIKNKGGKKPKSENGTVKQRRAIAKASGVKSTHKMSHEHLKKLGF